MYAMAAYAHDQAMRLHSVHPDQHPGADKRGTEMRMPGGRTGTKT